MLNADVIRDNLRKLDTLYKKSEGSEEALYYAKLAIIELCGWIEESMDNLLQDHCDKKLKDEQNLAYIKNQVIATNYGFDYNRNFRLMLIKLVGIIKVENLEAKINKTRFLNLKSALGNLKQVRDSVAHTYIKGTTINLDAPSSTIKNFNHVYDGLCEIKKLLR